MDCSEHLVLHTHTHHCILTSVADSGHHIPSSLSVNKDNYSLLGNYRDVALLLKSLQHIKVEVNILTCRRKGGCACCSLTSLVIIKFESNFYTVC